MSSLLQKLSFASLWQAPCSQTSVPSAAGSLPPSLLFPIRLSSHPGGREMITKRLTPTQILLLGWFSPRCLPIYRCYSIFLRAYHGVNPVSPQRDTGDFDSIRNLPYVPYSVMMLLTSVFLLQTIKSAPSYKRYFSNYSYSQHNVNFLLILYECIDLTTATIHDVFCCCYTQVLKIILPCNAKLLTAA